MVIINACCRFVNITANTQINAIKNKKNKIMIYKKYIELGFERYDLDDQVEFNQTGYGGFYLKYKLRKGVNIFANNGELDKPRIYIKNKRETPDYIIELTFDNVLDLLGTR